MEKEVLEDVLEKIEMKKFTRFFLEYIDISGELKTIEITAE